MIELPKRGDEYFHRKSLVPFVVGGEPDDMLIMLKLACVRETTFLTVTAKELHRDYARNEPVTLELLERMGWEMRFTPFLRIWSRGGLLFEKGRLIVMSDQEDMMPLAFSPPTLRDLLNVLRVFGVAANVPELSKENVS